MVTRENLVEDITRLLADIAQLENEDQKNKKEGKVVDITLVKLWKIVKNYKAEVLERKNFIDFMTIPVLENFKDTLEEYKAVLEKIVVRQNSNAITAAVEEEQVQ